MKQLNLINVALMLSQDQIKIIDNDLLPVDLSESVLFTINEREKLKLRIDELKVEKEESREERRKYAK